MFKRAYVRTEITKFLNALEKTLNRDLTENDIFENAPVIYKILKEDTENPLGDLEYEQFFRFVQIGHHIAMINSQRTVFTFGG